MAKRKDKGPRPLALVLHAEAHGGDAALIRAVREDLGEILQFGRIRVENLDEGKSAADAAAIIAGHRGPALATFGDVPGLPIEAVEGAIVELEASDIVIGPCADGSVYLLGLADGMPAEAAEVLIAAGMESLDELTKVVLEHGLEPATLPPWFRLRSAKDLSFAGCLARLSLQSEDGDTDFLADRFKNWLTERANP